MDAMVQPAASGGAIEIAGAGKPKVTARNVNVYYGDKHALKDVSVDIPARSVMAFIGPSGCGKSTFLRCINRMNDTIPIARVTGKIDIDDLDIYDKSLDVVQLRARVGMVFQKPNPFPKSIFENVAYGPRIHGISRSKSELDEIVMSQPEARRPLGRGQGSPGRFRHQPVRRSAATSLHRPGDCGRPRSHLDGRAVFGAGSDRDRAHRGTDRRIAAEFHDHHRDAFDAAGCPRLAADGVFPSRHSGRGGRYRNHLYDAKRPANSGLHHRPFRLTGCRQGPKDNG